jgi:hypothetical protein
MITQRIANVIQPKRMGQLAEHQSQNMADWTE